VALKALATKLLASIQCFPLEYVERKMRGHCGMLHLYAPEGSGASLDGALQPDEEEFEAGLVGLLPVRVLMRRRLFFLYYRESLLLIESDSF